MAAPGAHSKPYNITYPQEWADRDRMSYLLAPFPPSDKHPDLNDPKYCFWSSFILSSSKELHKPVTSARELQERFKWNGQNSPGCLNLVLEGMERMGEVVRASEFYRPTEQSWLSWGANVVKRPVVWALKSYLPSSGGYEGEYILNSVAKECAAAVMDAHRKTVVYKCTDNIMSYSDFQKLCSSVVSPGLSDVLTQQLLRSGQLARKQDIVKLSLVQDKGLEVTDVDTGILSIKDTAAVLSEQIRNLEQSISGLQQLARKKLKSKDKKEALRVLKLSVPKKSLLEHKHSMLENVQAVLHRIQSAETDAMVFAAYKVGVEAMKSVRKDMTLEKAEDMKAELQDLVEEGEDIAAVLGERVGPDVEDDDELLLELEQMMEPEAEPQPQRQGGGEDDLTALMAGLSVRDRAQDPTTPTSPGHTRDQQCTQQLPAVPTHVPSLETNVPPSVRTDRPRPLPA